MLLAGFLSGTQWEQTRALLIRTAAAMPAPESEDGPGVGPAAPERPTERPVPLDPPGGPVPARLAAPTE